MVATKQLRLAKEPDEERRGRLATKRLRLAMEMDEETQARLEKMVAQTAQVGQGDGRKKKRKTGE